MLMPTNLTVTFVDTIGHVKPCRTDSFSSRVLTDAQIASLSCNTKRSNYSFNCSSENDTVFDVFCKMCIV